MEDIKYGGVSIDEQECVIRLDARTGKAYIWSSWPKWSRKVERKYGIPDRYTEDKETGNVTSARWEIPADRISVRSLKPDGEISELAPSQGEVFEEEG